MPETYVEIGEVGYTDIRQTAVEKWFVEVRDGANQKIVRLDTTDPRCERVGASGSNPVQFKVTLTGADVGTLPREVKYVLLFKNSTDTTPIAQSEIPGALLYLETDTVVVTTPVYIPYTGD